MSTDLLPAPVAPRLRRPSWRDPRLVVGLVLVALAVALGIQQTLIAGGVLVAIAALGSLGTASSIDRMRRENGVVSVEAEPEPA